MLTLEKDRLVFRFPEVHEDATTEIELQITLRIPDDTRNYPLPPGLGRFPLRHTEDFSAKVPRDWRMRGGVMMPVHQTEAMWLSFEDDEGLYPFAVKVAAGKINAVSGKPWTPELDGRDTDYLVVPGQPWLDGFSVGKGQIRQFVAMPLGQGFTAEEQITGKAEWGGLQLIVYPMKRERWQALVQQREADERRQREAEEKRRVEAMAREAAQRQRAGALRGDMIVERRESRKAAPRPAVARAASVKPAAMPMASAKANSQANYSLKKAAPIAGEHRQFCRDLPAPALAAPAVTAMGLGSGGLMRQEIYRDPYGIDAWDQTASSRCFLTLVDAEDWLAITGEEVRRKPPTAQDYAKAGLPWFEYEAKGREALAGAPELTMLKTVGEVAEEKGLDPLPGNETVAATPLIKLGPDAA